MLFIALVTLLAFVAREYRIEHDLTRTRATPLPRPTLDVLEQLDGPVTVTAYAMASDARGDNVHRQIEEFLRPYQRAKPDIALTLVDPARGAEGRRRGRRAPAGGARHRVQAAAPSA